MVSQVLTMLLVRGVFLNAVLRADIRRTISSWDVPWEIPHSLLQAEIMVEKGFTDEYFTISVKQGECAWIGWRHGELVVFGDREPTGFDDWCGGDAEHGEDCLERRLGTAGAGRWRKC